jgi:hypothetical protein
MTFSYLDFIKKKSRPVQLNSILSYYSCNSKRDFSPLLSTQKYCLGADYTSTRRNDCHAQKSSNVISNCSYSMREGQKISQTLTVNIKTAWSLPLRSEFIKIVIWKRHLNKKQTLSCPIFLTSCQHHGIKIGTAKSPKTISLKL